MSDVKFKVRDQFTVEAATVGAALVGGVIVLVSVVSAALGVVSGATGESGIADGGLPYRLLIINILFVLVFVCLASRIRPHGEAFGVRRVPIGRLITATALVLLAMQTATLGNKLTRWWTGQDQWTGVSATYDVTFSEMLVLAAHAGVVEETLYVAIPVGTIYLGLSVLSRCRSRRGHSLIPRERMWKIALIVGISIGLFSRFAGHIYQGHTSALWGLVWGVAVGVIFAWVRSVWPLILGHAIHNIPVVHESWTLAIIVQFGLPLLVLAIGLVISGPTTRDEAKSREGVGDR